jgi:UDP-N-acetylglucosamine transferase subunit ALG13
LIFVTVGTQKFQFDRLLRALDELCQKKLINEEIIAQRGYSTYMPKNYNSFTMKSEEEINKLIRSSTFVISHGGTSSIIKCLKMGKKVLVVPRLKKFQEHIDDHQLEIAQAFERKNFIDVVYDINDLNEKIKKIIYKKFNKYDFGNKGLLSSIENYIKKILAV